VSARTDLIHVAIDRDRSPAPPSGIKVHRLAGFMDKVLWNASPPRVRVEEAVLDVAAGARDELAAIATLADAVRSRCTCASRMREALEGRSRVARRSLLHGVLADVQAGTCSVLEHWYLTRVERPHGLPTASRQLCESPRGTVYRDLVYLEFKTYVELDGRLFHESTLDRDRDLERDLDLAVDGRLSVRLGWGQVFRRPCSTAPKVGLVLRARGWQGHVRRCPSCADDGPR